MNLASALSELRASVGASTDELNFPSTPIESVFSDGQPCRLALQTDNTPALLLPAGTNDLKRRLPQCAGLELRITSYTVSDGAARYFIELRCLRQELESAFVDLLQNICARIESGDPAVKSLHKAIEDFRDLLRSSVGAADRKKALGLFGELSVLAEVVARKEISLSSWTGPTGHRRDFCFKNAALEVKTSEKTDRRTVHISSLGQLSTDDVETLFLWYLRVEEDPSAGESIGDIVSKLKNMLFEAEELGRLLGEVGYTPESREAFNSYRWRLLESCPYIVSKGFPRITHESFSPAIPVGVQEVSYTSDLNCATDFKVSAEQVLKSLEE